MTLARTLAEFATQLKYQDLPSDVIHQTKRVLLDTLGCAIGGYDSEAREAIEAYIKESGHPGEATVFGSGFRTSSLNATLVNVKRLSGTVDEELTPVLDRLNASSGTVEETLAQGRATLADAQRALAALERAAARAEQTMGSANALVQPNSPVVFDMSNALREITAAARSMRNLSDTIARDPNSLLFGRTRPGGAR